jgi:hypothetical protein
MTIPDAVAAHARVVEEAWTRLLRGDRVVSVDSPPGAGKSTLVADTAERYTAANEHDQLAIVTQTNEQADDLVLALSQRFSGSRRRVGRLHASDYVPPVRLNGVQHVDFGRQVHDLAGTAAVVAPAAKWAYASGAWQLAIIDEVHQMRSDALLRIADRYEQLLAVGDPGQLNPFTTGDESLVRGLPLGPIETAAATLRTTHPHDVLQLPVSWRLTPAAARLVSKAFYVDQFQAATPPGFRRVDLRGAEADTAEDEALDAASRSGWALIELPEARLRRTDPAVVSTISTVVQRLLTRGGATHDGDTHRVISPASVAVGVAHRNQRSAVQAELDSHLAAIGINPGSVVVDTANRLQGRQFEFVVAWHPLSGQRDATAFHLEAGRLCVLLSRHRQACVVVARAGIASALSSYPATDPIWVSEPERVIDGWEANLSVLEQLGCFRIAA